MGTSTAVPLQWRESGLWKVVWVVEEGVKDGGRVAAVRALEPEELGGSGQRLDVLDHTGLPGLAGPVGGLAREPVYVVGGDVKAALLHT